ncbi:MAG TPA: hypothetical protein VLZ10_04960 [Thermodesulfobacteriota bacterium]|nr:hypothetical protein [Thermodesulfobacteriota bacterium]
MKFIVSGLRFLGIRRWSTLKRCATGVTMLSVTTKMRGGLCPGKMYSMSRGPLE